ncbi:hypothetical protein OJF2_68570 [Aquisphaera giovannonii]|uniref:CheW-like domain-containing protein n=1 Tax=Aquisphaera giovannonii TaxID=406548 RepID=A0A5B9WDE6_9BACT|nr:chemotaxis protein CheW [Aquisphaera giovannonii]QEH38259.1 hypothetical protein OJF2_68570 [Aquisphaera giovannonii]
MPSDPTYCLFRCDTRPLAMAVEHVAEIAEVGPLVRMSRCPRQVAGLFVYHQHVLPVLSLDGHPRAPDAVALVARTEAGLWALGIDRGGTQIVAARPARHDPARGEDGLVTAGLIRREGADHALVDAEASWRSFRILIEGSFARPA